MMIREGNMEINVSAPGKILLTGGYNVLSLNRGGLVVSTNSRIFVSVKAIDMVAENKDTGPSKSLKFARFLVLSPQFAKGDWEYVAVIVNGSEDDNKENLVASISESSIFSNIENTSPRMCFTQIKGEPNSTIGKLLQIIFTFAYHRNRKAIEEIIKTDKILTMMILADNDFYSQHSTLDSMSKMKHEVAREYHTIESVLGLPRFSFLGTTLVETHKSGLGSSAALISALSTAVLTYVLGLDINKPGDMDTCYALSQLVNIVLQEGNGSCADIAGTFFGSHYFLSHNLANIKETIAKRNQNITSLLSSVSETTPKSLNSAASLPKSSVVGSDNSSQRDKSEKEQCIDPKLHMCNICTHSYVMGAPLVNQCVELLIAANNNMKKRILTPLPPGIVLVSLDFSMGSKSLKLASRFIAWHTKCHSIATSHMEKYSKACSTWHEPLAKLVELYKNKPSDYCSIVEAFSNIPSFLWKDHLEKFSGSETAATFVQLYENATMTRKLFKEFVELSGIPTEPKEFTPIIDHIYSLNGIIWAGTTGAGGYDAISMLALSRKVPLSKEEEILNRMPVVANIQLSVVEFMKKNKMNTLKPDIPGCTDNFKYPLPLLDGAASFFDPPERQGVRIETDPPYSLSYNS